MKYEAQALVKSYGGTPALTIDQLEFGAGDFVALLGKNGSGKSTLMRLLGQQELKDSGRLDLDGRSLNETTLKVNQRVVFLSEDQSLPFHRPLSRWVQLYRGIHPGYDDEVVESLRERLNVDASKSLGAMSRGQRMKALFCLEAGRRPDGYLVDEITAVLDSGSRWSVMEFLHQEVGRGALVVLSTNIATELQGFATRLFLLDEGKVQFTAAVDHVASLFKKWRCAPDADEAVLVAAGARRISYNDDRSWTYLAPRDAPLPSGLVADRREITIAEVQSFFTGQEPRS